MLRTVKGKTQKIVDGGTKKVEGDFPVEPCIRPGLSLVYIPGNSVTDDGVDSIQLPKGSLSWHLSGDPHISDGKEVDKSTSGAGKR